MRKINVKLIEKAIDKRGRQGLQKMAIEVEISITAMRNLLNGNTKNPSLTTVSNLLRATGESFDRLFPLIKD